MHLLMNIMRGSRRLPLTRLALATFVAVPLVGCDLNELLEVEEPFTITPVVARDTTRLANTFAGAVTSFGTAFGGWRNNYGGIVMHTGLASDELYSTDAFANRWALDRRAFNYEQSNAESDRSFEFLQRARAEGLGAAELFAQTSQRNSAQHGELYLIAGFSTLMLAENFCSGVPLSQVTPDGTFEYGSPLPTGEVYDRAIALFDSAMATASNSTRVVNAARIGKARALLGKGEFSAAAAVAAQVPSNAGPYLVEFEAAASRTENAVYQFNYDERRISASLQEGTINQGLPYGSTVDPRTPINPNGVQANSGTTPVYLQLKYPTGSADIPLATAYEARYIQAEAALRADQITQFEQLLNQARALQSLPALTSAQIGTTRDERIDTLFRERAYAMWLTGHRFSDMRRLIRQYNRPYEQVFPTGTAPNGQVYGTDASFPIPFEEVNNPNFKGCIDTSA